MKTFMMVLLIAGPDWQLYSIELVSMYTKELCVFNGRRNAWRREQIAIEDKDSGIKKVTFIDCYEGALYSEQRPLTEDGD